MSSYLQKKVANVESEENELYVYSISMVSRKVEVSK